MTRVPHLIFSQVQNWASTRANLILLVSIQDSTASLRKKKIKQKFFLFSLFTTLHPQNYNSKIKFNFST